MAIVPVGPSRIRPFHQRGVEEIVLLVRKVFASFARYIRFAMGVEVASISVTTVERTLIKK